MSMSEFLMFSAAVLPVALWLDSWLGEPNRYHPLVGFGCWVNRVELSCRKLTNITEKSQGIIAWCVAVIPIVLMSMLVNIWLLSINAWLWFAFNVVVVYFTIGGKSLIQHADNIYRPLKDADIESARYQVSMIVSRNTEKMSEDEIVSSTIESVLENGNDAVFAPMIWFLLLGAPGAVLLRLANTLDAMWGYKNDKYINFGWCSAKIDDALGWLPARVTAVVYAIQGNSKQALWCWKHQAKKCSSPNGGVVMTSGAGSINVQIGGPTYYHGVLHNKEPMGVGNRASWSAIFQANKLVTNGSFMFSYVWFASVLLGVS